MSRNRKRVDPVQLRQNITENEAMTRTDKRIVWAVTLVYLLIALLNLGTLSFPVSYYHATGEPVAVRFSSPVTVEKVWINANVSCDTVIFAAGSGDVQEYEPEDGDMFQWAEMSLELPETDYITVTMSEGSEINELAFFDEAGRLIPCTVVSGSGAELIDEQDTVPARPSYFIGMYFDEIYHARTAYEFTRNMSVYEWTHPPLGKLIISVGILIFGMKPFGWRCMGALFGAGMLPILYVFSKRIFKRTDYAALTTLLMAADCMHFTQTRIATIDVYAVFFIILMFFFMYEFVRKPYLETPVSVQLRHLLLCGLSFACGCSSKWTGCYAGAGLAVVLFWRLAEEGIDSKKRGEDAWAGYKKKTLSVLLHCCAFFVAIPAVIYYLSFFPFYRYKAATIGEYSFKDTFRTLIDEQKSMYSYHSNLTATHLCQSKWFQWPFTVKSVWFYVSRVGDKLSNISSTGNPAVWWVSAVGFVCLVLERAMGKIKKAPVHLILFVGVAANYLPWILVDRCVFLYHFFATVPFILLSAVYLLYTLEQRGAVGKNWKWVWLGVAIVYFILLFPAISGIPTGFTYASFLENTLPAGYLYYGWV